MFFQRSILLILLLSCFIFKVSAQTWVSQNSGILTRLYGVCFVNRDVGYVVGTNGLMLTTENGGLDWTKKTVITREILRDIAFVDNDRGFILGEYSIFNRPDLPKGRSFLLSTSDKGKEWGDVSLYDEELKVDDAKRYNGLGIVRMVFVDDRTAWACGEAGLMMVTRNAGRTWQRQVLPINKLYFDIAALDESSAWTVGGGGVILRTVDGGKNWNEQQTGITKTLRGVHFIDSKRGWAVGSSGAIITTTNGGNRWQVQTSGTEENLNTVYFSSRSEGWAAGDRGVLLHTTDAGAHWEKVNIKSRSNFSRFFFIAPDVGWLVGSNGAIFKYQK